MALSRRHIILSAVLVFVACYDDPSLVSVVSSSDNTFAYVDATSYTEWVYVDITAHTTLTLPYDDEENLPASWTLALHRYDVKTNAGSAYETPFSLLSSLSAALAAGTYTLPSAEEYVADEWGEIYVDLSQMMDSVVVSAPARLNKELGRWLDVDISDMPPFYTPSNRVYLLRTREEEIIALLFTGFSNPYYYDAKGYISFEYLFL